MLRGTHPPPPPQHPFFLFLSISFPSLFKKKSENFRGGGGLDPLNPPPLNTPLIVPIVKNKSCNLSDSSNYRPIALATIVSKMFYYLNV